MSNATQSRTKEYGRDPIVPGRFPVFPTAHCISNQIAGTLHYEDPIYNSKKTATITNLAFVRQPCAMFVLKSDYSSTSDDLVTHMLMYNLAPFTNFTNEKDQISPVLGPKLAASLISAFLNIIASDERAKCNSLLTAYNKSLYKLISVDVENRRSFNELAEANKDHGAYGYLKGQLTSNMNDCKMAICVYLGIVCIGIAKNLTVKNLDKWYAARVRGIAASLGAPNVVDILGAGLAPSLTSMNNFYQFVTSTPTLRREIFYVMQRFSTMDSSFGAMFRSVLLLLKGAEMSHIMMIDRYLVRKYTELWKLSELAGEWIPLLKIYEYLGSLEKEEVQYAKIIHSQEETSVMNRRNVQLAASVAHVCAKYESPGMVNLVVKDNAMTTALRAKVEMHIARRGDLATLDLMAHSGLEGEAVDRFRTTETERILEQIMRHVKDKGDENPEQRE
ncbi:hypothetical protein [Strepsipteran arli-related virus OKIAV104]|uniref:Uncharacterized protein n=1 Tax=Strepsipteran arli-related virus OKIAV104 TaxID=2746355 RepID=A0AAE7IF33_9MONO|nr:hypothetical protein QKS54_gp1 [Strepsipteran arli-related virus OKIAV104]QMP82288.1 hypothetical protein [Strepsipteran arli-related virus OKIAV104]